jgi:hypothetical protein
MGGGKEGASQTNHLSGVFKSKLKNRATILYISARYLNYLTLYFTSSSPILLKLYLNAGSSVFLYRDSQF